MKWLRNAVILVAVLAFATPALAQDEAVASQYNTNEEGDTLLTVSVSREPVEGEDNQYGFAVGASYFVNNWLVATAELDRTGPGLSTGNRSTGVSAGIQIHPWSGYLVLPYVGMSGRFGTFRCRTEGECSDRVGVDDSHEAQVLLSVGVDVDTGFRVGGGDIPVLFRAQWEDALTDTTGRDDFYSANGSVGIVFVFN